MRRERRPPHPYKLARAQAEAAMQPFRVPKKSFWRDRTSRIWSFYCPCCQLARKIPYQPHPGPRHALQIGLCTAMFMLLSWNLFSWKGAVVFLPFWLIFEMLYRTRVRAALACEACGFDPFLYLNDLPRAREVVENHWRKKFEEKGIPFPEKKSPSPASPSSNAGLTGQV